MSKMLQIFLWRLVLHAQDDPMPYVSVTAAKGFNLRRITKDSRMAVVTQYNSSKPVQWNEMLVIAH